MTFLNFTPHRAISRAVWKSPMGVTGLVARDGKLAAIYPNVQPERFAHEVELAYGSAGQVDLAPFTETMRQLEQYFAGERLVFKLDLDLDQGTPFQRRVWKALRDIPYGLTVTYKEIAQAIGQPSATRAVGSANGANPIPVVVPCHRVVAAGGKLGGFSAGLYMKQRLLDLETQTRLRASTFGMFTESPRLRAR